MSFKSMSNKFNKIIAKCTISIDLHYVYINYELCLVKSKNVSTDIITNDFLNYFIDINTFLLFFFLWTLTCF